MKQGINITGFLMIFLLSACQTSVDSVASAKGAVADNVNKSVTIGAIRYDFKLRTAEAMAIPNSYNDSNALFDEKKFQQSIEEKEEVQYLIINHQVDSERIPILKYEATDYEIYNKRVEYYSFHVSKDVYLICGKDTLRAIGSHYENNMELMPYNSMIFAFPSCEDAKEIKVLFNDIPFENFFIKVSFKM